MKTLFTISVLLVMSCCSLTPAQSVLVLSSADVNGAGDNGGVPWEFEFNNPFAPREALFEVALVQFVDYDGLGIAIFDDMSTVVEPLVSFSPAQNILFDFTSSAPSLTASVAGVGDTGVFGLDIQATAVPVPEPSSILPMMLAVALSAMSLLRRQGR